MDFLTLQRHQVESVANELRSIAQTGGLTNTFNPSLLLADGEQFIAFRAESTPGERPFRAFLARVGRDGSRDLTDLTALSEPLGALKTADPKLVNLGGEIFVTFNTGNVHQGQNEVYLQRVSPEFGPPQRCVFAGRRMVEKNWGFYKLDNEDLRLIYSLAPLTILRHIGGVLGTQDDLTFAAEIEGALTGRFPRLHIGSQPAIVRPGRALVVANQQWPIPGLPRKIYFGRLAEIDLRTGTVIRLSRRGLIHSWRSMLYQKRRHNPGLFSATYFSGLTTLHDHLVLSYGVNDMTFGISQIPESRLWGR